VGRVVKCFLDKNNIRPGEDWENSFTKGLQSSRLFVPLISVDGMKPLETLGPDLQDNVLYEYEMALELAEVAQITICPLFAGRYISVDSNKKLLDKFDAFDYLRFPETASKTYPAKSVRETMRQLMRKQGVHVDPDDIPTVIPGLVRKVEELLSFA